MPGGISDLSSLALSCSPGTPSSCPLSRVLSQLSQFRLASHAARWAKKTNGSALGQPEALHAFYRSSEVVPCCDRAAACSPLSTLLAVCRPAPPPCYQAKVTCRRTVRGLAQPLVAAAVGPAHSCQLSASVFNQCQCGWSGGHQEEREVRGRPQPSPLPTYPVLGQRVN